MTESAKPRMDVEVAPLVEADVDELAELDNRVYRASFAQGMDEDDLVKYLQVFRSPEYFREALKTGTILVAKREGKLAGYVLCGDVKIPEVEAAAEDREIGRVYVDTDLQGQGIGRQLMTSALALPDVEAAPNVYLQVFEDNSSAIGLYESLGFHTIGKTSFMIGDTPAEDLIMVREKP